MDDAQARDVAVQAAQEGGKLARVRLGNPGYLRWKGHRDVVAAAALEVQEAVLSVLREAYPGDAFFPEEGPEDEPVEVDAQRLWIVDPICGSLNFVRGIPFFAISIALRTEEGIRVGVVYDPIRDELFEATVGQPARLNGQAIAVAPTAEGYEFYEQAWVGTDLPTSGPRRDEALRVLHLVSNEVLGVNVLGSPALGMCYVAAGRLHVYWTLDARPWDVAAAGLIARAAGGVITDLEGGSWLYSDGGYVVCTPTLYRWAIRSIRDVRSAPRRE